MVTLFLALIFFAATGLLGYLFWVVWPQPDRPESALVWLSRSLLAGVVLMGGISFLLAQLHIFSLTAVLFTAWLLIAAAAFFRRPHPAPLFPDWKELLLLTLTLITAALFFRRPHNFWLGGADAGVYVNLGAHIAASGSLTIENETLATLDPALYPALLRPLPPGENAPYYLFPAFFVPETGNGRIIPQFYHLHAVWLAVAHEIAGLQPSLMLNGIWALLTGLLLYTWMRRRYRSYPYALLMLLALSGNALQLWFARYPTTEMVTQYLFWGGLWAYANWLQQKTPAWGMLAGLSWGSLFLVRIDFYFLWLAVGLIGLWQYQQQQLKREDAAFYLPLTLLTLYSLTYGWLFSTPYFLTVFGYGLALLQHYWWLPLTAVISLTITLFLISRFRGELNRLAFLQDPLLWLALLLTLLLAAYSWWIRPHLPAASRSDWFSSQTIPLLDQENLIRLGWYLSPVGIGLGVAGICLWWRQWRRETAAILLSSLIFTLLYLWRLQTNPHQIYTMRRYVPVVMPLFIIAGGALLAWLDQQRPPFGRWLAALLAVGWLAGIGLAAPPFATQVDYPDLPAQLTRFNAQLPPHSILLFHDPSPIGQGDLLGTPLHFIYGHDVFSLRDSALLDTTAFSQQLRQWQAAGRTVIWLETAETDGWPFPETPLPTGIRYQLETTALEGRYDQRPTNRINRIWTGVFTLLPSR